MEPNGGGMKTHFLEMRQAGPDSKPEIAHAPSIGIIRTGTKGFSQHVSTADEYPCVRISIKECGPPLVEFCYRRSKMAAMPCPPPMHMVTRA